MNPEDVTGFWRLPSPVLNTTEMQAGDKENTDEERNNHHVELKSNGLMEKNEDEDDDEDDTERLDEDDVDEEEDEAMDSLVSNARFSRGPPPNGFYRDDVALKRSLFVIPATMLGYWASEFISTWLVLKYAPKQMVWARRYSPTPTHPLDYNHSKIIANYILRSSTT